MSPCLYSDSEDENIDVKPDDLEWGPLCETVDRSMVTYGELMFFHTRAQSTWMSVPFITLLTTHVYIYIYSVYIYIYIYLHIYILYNTLFIHFLLIPVIRLGYDA